MPEKSSTTLVCQVNGKVRDKIEVPVDAEEDVVVELARKQENVEKFIEGNTIRKIIYVPNKILNFVVS